MIEAEIVPFFGQFAMKREGWPPLFYSCFVLAKATQKYIYSKGEKNLDTLYERLEFPHLESQYCVLSGAHRVIWGYLILKI